MFLCLFLFSCVHPQSRLSFGDFNDQVLELLASRIAYEQVEHAKSEVMRAYAERERKIAEGRPGSTEKQLLSALGAWVGGPVGFSLMEGLFNLDDSEFQKVLVKSSSPIEDGYAAVWRGSCGNTKLSAIDSPDFLMDRAHVR